MAGDSPQVSELLVQRQRSLEQCLCGVVLFEVSYDAPEHAHRAGLAESIINGSSDFEALLLEALVISMAANQYPVELAASAKMVVDIPETEATIPLGAQAGCASELLTTLVTNVALRGMLITIIIRLPTIVAPELQCRSTSLLLAQRAQPHH